MRRRAAPALLLLLLVLLPSAAGGCRSRVMQRGVERRVERRLAALMGPGHYRVRIPDTPTSELVLGRARTVEVQASGVVTQGEIPIERVELTLYELRYEGAEPYFVSVRHSRLEVEVTEEAVNRYLRVELPRYQPLVRFERDRAHVQMVYNFLGTPTTIRAAGRLVIENGRRLIFDAESVDLSFIDHPGFGEKFVEDRVNPLLDLTRIRFPASLEEVTLLQGRIRASGTAALPREERH